MARPADTCLENTVGLDGMAHCLKLDFLAGIARFIARRNLIQKGEKYSTKKKKRKEMWKSLSIVWCIYSICPFDC